MSVRPLNFLFTTWDGGGCVPPMLTIAAELVQRGHRARMMSDPSNREEAELAGATFVPWTTAPHRSNRCSRDAIVRDWEVDSPADGFALTLRSIMTGPAPAYARDVLAELDREPADLVVSSEMLLGVMAACESRKQRLALFAANLCVFPLPGMPAFGPGLPPPRTAADRELHGEIRRATLEMADVELGALNAARAKLELPPLEHLIDQLDAAAALLLGTSRAFDFPAEDPPAKIRYVGPQLREPGWVAPWTPPWSRLDCRPLVLVAFSTTFQNHAGAVQAAIDAAARLPVRALVTLGLLEPTEVRGASNVWLARSAPHEAVLPEAAVVVTHGGHGTVMRSLRYGRPMLILPHGRDQNDNAVRVAERGAGLVLPAAASSEEIHGALARLLQEPEFGRAAERLGRAIAAEANEISAAVELETLAAGA